jgi:hypothetical protein
MGLIIFSVSVGLVTLFMFPILAYFSAALYGLPAAVFLLIGYVVAVNILSTNSKMGIAFAVGFIPPVALCLSECALVRHSKFASGRKLVGFS